MVTATPAVYSLLSCGKRVYNELRNMGSLELSMLTVAVAQLSRRINESANYSMAIALTSLQLPLNTILFLPHGSV